MTANDGFGTKPRDAMVADVMAGNEARFCPSTSITVLWEITLVMAAPSTSHVRWKPYLPRSSITSKNVFSVASTWMNGDRLP